MPIVLGYGALMCPQHVSTLYGAGAMRSFRRGRLTGYRRHWNVVYRNGCWADGSYDARGTGEPHPGGVAFLGVRVVPDAELIVSELTVDDAALAVIDAEEYLYRRRDVAGSYLADGGPPPSGPVWLYQDVPEDFPEGHYVGTDVVITRTYWARVTGAAARLAPELPDSFTRTTDPSPWPIADLVWRG